MAQKLYLKIQKISWKPIVNHLTCWATESDESKEWEIQSTTLVLPSEGMLSGKILE